MALDAVPGLKVALWRPKDWAVIENVKEGERPLTRNDRGPCYVVCDEQNNCKSIPDFADAINPKRWTVVLLAASLRAGNLRWLTEA